MNIYDKINRMADQPGTYEEKLYGILQSPKYSKGIYQVHDLGEGMSIVEEVINGWWKPRFLLNNEKKKAFEVMTGTQILMLAEADDIDWDSLANLPEDAIITAQMYSFMYPSFVTSFHNGVSLVTWQLNPDGRYYMDDDGYGMTNDLEVEIYGFIDKGANVIVKFQAVGENQLPILRHQAEQIVKQKSEK